MSKPAVVVFDYGSGNVHSAVKALQLAGAEVQLTRDRKLALSADGLVVPGVGGFAAVMSALSAAGGPSIIDKRLSGGKSVLGICVGLQVMFETGTEGSGAEGLGQWPGQVRQLKAPILPHIGWSKVAPPSDSKLFEGIEDERFYFVHSYAATDWLLETAAPFPPALISYASHGESFIAAVENGPLSGTQFHPEKSGPAGIKLLQNWIAQF